MHQGRVWDALVLGFMELQGGYASQHSAEKQAKPIFFFTFLPLNPFFTSSPPKNWVLQSIPYFRRKGQEGVLFSDTP